MIGPGSLEVLLHVPEHIRNGLADGSLTPWGGTIRDAQGRIRALLSEGRGLADLLQQGSPLDLGPLTEAVGHAQTAAQIASSLSALNLTVSASGFTMVRKRLDVISDRLSLVLRDLAIVKEELGWINLIQMAQLRADVDTACELALTAHRTSDRALSRDAGIRAYHARRTLRHTMSAMLDTQRVVARFPVFTEFVRATAVLAVVEARCAEATEGADRAASVLQEASCDLALLVREFERQRLDFGTGFEDRIRMGNEGRVRLGIAARDLLDLLRQLEGTASRFGLQGALGLTAGEWQRWVTPENSGLLTCIVAPEESSEDLTEIARKLRRPGHSTNGVGA